MHHVPSELWIELAPAVDAVRAAGRELAELLRGIDEPGRPARGVGWTLGELAAHLASRTRLFAAYLAGVTAPQGEIEGIAQENERLVRAEAGRPVPDLADELEGNVETFVAATRGRLGSDPFPWYSGLTLDVATATGLLLGELRVHGDDAARGLGRPWAIASADARTIVRAATVLAPRYVDPTAARGVSTTYLLEVRGGPRFRIAFEDGAVRLEPPDGPADAAIRADPAALVLVAYGRRSRWWAIVRRKLVAGGPKPWRALAFDRYFLPP